MEHSQALEIARRVEDQIRPYCSRVEIAGSVRRGKPDVKDIEICAIPNRVGKQTLFGVWEEDAHIDASALGRPVKDGPKYKQIELPEGIKLDLFLVTPPAQWGYIFALRTGPAEFSKYLVTKKRYGGFLPSWAIPHDGGIYVSKRASMPIDMPEEKDFFKLCELPYLEPTEREGYFQEWLNTKNRRR